MTENGTVESNARNEGTTPRKGGRPSSLIEQERVCPTCGTSFMTKVNPDGRVAKGYKSTYCSRACSRQVANVRAGEANRAEYEANPHRCPCGNPIRYEKRHFVLYCSNECRATYGAKKGRETNLANYITFNCETCGNEVTRYRKYGNGASRFCSNECAAKHTKKIQHIVVENAVVLDSSYEAFVWGALRIAKVQVERFDRQYAIEWSTDHWYAPDLWLPLHEVAIECKGLEDPDDQARWHAYRERGCLITLSRADLVVLSPEKLLTMIGVPE